MGKQSQASGRGSPAEAEALPAGAGAGRYTGGKQSSGGEDRAEAEVLSRLPVGVAGVLQHGGGGGGGSVGGGGGGDGGGDGGGGGGGSGGGGGGRRGSTLAQSLERLMSQLPPEARVRVTQ